MKKNFKIRDNSIVKCKTQAPEVDIPLKQKVTEIAEKTFSGNKYVEKVNLLGNIRIINKRAFENAKELREVSFSPASMVSISDYSFRKCKKLETIENMGVIISYGRESFKGCRNLETSDIHPYLVDLGKSCFEGCKNITSVTLPILQVEIPKRLFYDCEKLEKVEMNEMAEIVCDKAFYGCTSLKEISFGDALNTVCNSAFEGCYSLEEATFGAGIKTIEKNAFKDCRSLKTVEFAELNVKKAKVAAKAFGGCFELRTVIIPGGKWKIKPSAFRNCKLSADAPLTIITQNANTAKKLARSFASLIKKGYAKVMLGEEEYAVGTPKNAAKKDAIKDEQTSAAAAIDEKAEVTETIEVLPADDSAKDEESVKDNVIVEVTETPEMQTEDAVESAPNKTSLTVVENTDDN